MPGNWLAIDVQPATTITSDSCTKSVLLPMAATICQLLLTATAVGKTGTIGITGLSVTIEPIAYRCNAAKSLREYST